LARAASNKVLAFLVLPAPTPDSDKSDSRLRSSSVFMVSCILPPAIFRTHEPAVYKNPVYSLFGSGQQQNDRQAGYVAYTHQNLSLLNECSITLVYVLDPQTNAAL